MTKAIIFLLLCGLAVEACGQKYFDKIDSLVAAAQYEIAAAEITKAAASSKDPRAKILFANKTAEIMMTQGRLDEASAVLQSINSKGDVFLDAVTQSNIGFLYLIRARNDLALENLQQALGKFKTSGKQNTKEAARCLANLSLLYFSTGKLNQAEENGLIALQIRQSLFSENSEPVAASYNDLGLVYAQTDIDKALEYHEKALSVYEKLLGPNHPKIAQAKSNIGISYLKLNLYGDAVNNFETAVAILKKNYPDGHPSEAFAFMNLGLTYLQMKDSKTSLTYLEKALEMYKKFYGLKHSDIASAYNQIGLIYLTDRKWDEALKVFQEALCANSPAFNKKSIADNPKVSQYYNGKVLLYSLRFKSQALEAKYYGKSLDFTQLKLALSSLYSCDSLIDNIRHQSADENDKISLGELANETYEDGVRIGMAMSEMSIDYKSYQRVAFYFAEKSKSAVLQESIADAEAKSFAGIPPAMLEQEKTLKSEMALIVQKLTQKLPSQEEKTLRETQFNLNEEYRVFIKNLEKDYPDYFNLKFNQSAPSVSSLQQLLDPKTGIVSYFIAEKSKKIYQFIVTKNHYKIKAVSMPDDFDKNIKGFANSLFFSSIETYKKSSAVLCKALVPQLPSSVTNLIIIPSGKLGTLPFEALPFHAGFSGGFSDAPYLLKRLAISYEFSAGLLTQKNKTVPAPAQASIFLCAPINFSEQTHLGSLPGTESEVNAIATLFGPSAASVVTLANATEDLAKSGKLASYNYLHFATHGVVDQTSPELSRIFLHESPLEDGNLFAGEIYNLKLNASLAVLSACQTGLGKFSKGEGVIGLSRALVYAGARNIIVSFWSVADASTSILMQDFYGNLLQRKDQGFRETLQGAKLKMIASKTYAAPYYWAPFVLIGF